MLDIGRGSDQFNLRMPEGLRDRIKGSAKENRRSMNSEIVLLVEQALSAKRESKKGDASA